VKIGDMAGAEFGLHSRLLATRSAGADVSGEQDGEPKEPTSAETRHPHGRKH